MSVHVEGDGVFHHCPLCIQGCFLRYYIFCLICCSGIVGFTKEQRIEVTSGVVTGTRIDETNYRIRLTDVTTLKLDFPIVIDGKAYENSYVELGDPGIPHAVVPIEGLSDFDENELFVLGRKMRYSTAFYKGANINFYEIIGEDMIIEKTYERGVEDVTYACGTGTGSVGAVMTGSSW